MTWRRAIAAVSAGAALGVASGTATFLLYVEIADGRTRGLQRLSRGNT